MIISQQKSSPVRPTIAGRVLTGPLTIGLAELRRLAGKLGLGAVDENGMSTSRNDYPCAASVPLVSEFAGDAEMAELIEYFLGELQNGVDSMTSAWQQGDTAQLAKLAHQLKGAAGGYGFPSITHSAADLESLLASQQFDATCVTEKVEALITLCRRAAASS